MKKVKWIGLGIVVFAVLMFFGSVVLMVNGMSDFGDAYMLSDDPVYQEAVIDYALSYTNKFSVGSYALLLSVVVGFAGIVVFIVGLVVNSSGKKDEIPTYDGAGVISNPLLGKKICTKCGVPNELGNDFCKACGSKFPESESSDSAIHNCPSCGGSVDDGDDFCQSCGHKLTQ